MEYILEKSNIQIETEEITSLAIKYPTQKEAREVLAKEFDYRKAMSNVTIQHQSVDALYYTVDGQFEAFWFVKPYEEYKERS